MIALPEKLSLLLRQHDLALGDALASREVDLARRLSTSVQQARRFKEELAASLPFPHTVREPEDAPPWLEASDVSRAVSGAILTAGSERSEENSGGGGAASFPGPALWSMLASREAWADPVIGPGLTGLVHFPRILRRGRVVELSGESHSGKTRLAVSLAALTLLFTKGSVAFIGTSLDNYIGMIKTCLTKFYGHFIAGGLERNTARPQDNDALPPGKLEEYFSRLNMMSLTDPASLPSVLEEGGSVWRLFQAKPDVSLLVVDSIGSLRVISGAKADIPAGDAGAQDSAAASQSEEEPPVQSAPPAAPRAGGWRGTKHALVLSTAKSIRAFAQITQCAVLVTNQVTAYIEGPEMQRTARWLSESGKFPGQSAPGSLPALRTGLSTHIDELFADRGNRETGARSRFAGRSGGSTGAGAESEVWELEATWEMRDGQSTRSTQNTRSTWNTQATAAHSSRREEFAVQRLFFRYLSPEEGGARSQDDAPADLGDFGGFGDPRSHRPPSSMGTTQSGPAGAPLGILASLAQRVSEDVRAEADALWEALVPQTPPPQASRGRGEPLRGRDVFRSSRARTAVHGHAEREDASGRVPRAPRVQLLPTRAEGRSSASLPRATLERAPAPRTLPLGSLSAAVELLLRAEEHEVPSLGRTVYRDAILAEGSGQTLTPALGLAFPQYLDTRVILTQRHGHVLWSRDGPSGSFVKG